MKILESPLIGKRTITARDRNARLFQVKQTLVMHRDLLINKLLKDIPYFLAFKYHAWATELEVEQVKLKLMHLQQRDLDLVNYAGIVEMIQHRNKVKINNELFYQEIDQMLLE
jgi:hypothetical protein